MGITSYIKTLIRSFTSSEVYIALLTKEWWRSFLFFSASMMLAGISTAIYFQQKTVPVLSEHVSKIATEVEHTYPQDLRISWNGTHLETSSTEPLAIEYPQYLGSNMKPPGKLAYILPFETQGHPLTTTTPSLSQLVFTKDSVYVGDTANYGSGVLLSSFEVQPFTLTKENVPEVTRKVQSLLYLQLEFAKILSLAIGPLYEWTRQCITSLFQGLLVFFVFKLYQVKLSFIKTWQLTLHLVVMATLVEHITRWLYQPSPLPMFSLTFWGIFLYIMATRSKEIKRFALSQ